MFFETEYQYFWMVFCYQKVFSFMCISLRGWCLPKYFFQNICFFLETTNLASTYLKTCFTVKIWVNLMHINLISRLIHATVTVPRGGEKIIFTKMLRV